MASTIKIKRSSVPNKVPTTSDINAGELALNLYDRKLYSSTGSAVFEIGNSGSNGSILGSYSTTALGDLTRNSNVVTSVTYTPANRYLQVANAVVTYATKISPTTSGILAHTGRATISTNLTVSGNTVVSGLVANGSLGTAGHYLRTNGTTTYWSPAAAGSSGASWAALTSTNTAIRLLVSDRLQVANAAAIYQTKSVERAALANTNSRITLVNTNLTGTNTAIRTLVSDRLQVANASATYQTKTIERAALANTNAFIKSQLANTNLRVNLINTNLTATNTAIRLLASDRLQVANAVATYQTKTVERAALANTNSRITLVNTNLTGTNTAIRTLVSDRLQVANAVATYATKVSPTTSGVLAHTGRATISTNLTVSGNTVIGRLVANGSLGTSNYVLKTNGTTVFWGAASTPAYVTQSLGSLTRSSNVVTSITSLADGVAIAPSNLYLQVANAVSTYATKASMAIKTFNITGSFSGPVSGTFRYVPLSSVTITKVQLTNQSAVTGDLVIGLNKNGSQLTTYTLSSGNYTQTYTGQNYAITSSDYITVDVVSGSGANFSLVLAA